MPIMCTRLARSMPWWRCLLRMTIGGSTRGVNRDRWLPWLDRFITTGGYGPDHPNTLTTRKNIAAFTGRAGDPGEALRLFTGLLPDHQRVLGPDHPDTLRTRQWIAYLSGNPNDEGRG